MVEPGLNEASPPSVSALGASWADNCIPKRNVREKRNVKNFFIVLWVFDCD
jgi:hypothetical protein